MAKFLTTTGISSKIEKIIKEANKKIVLVSPYLKLSKNLYERLLDASDLGKQVILVYRENNLKEEERLKLLSIQNITLYHSENLHAKCYLNERELIITSMNLYEFSEKNNREMGIFISKIHDPELYINAIEEVGSIIKASIEIEKQKPKTFAKIFKEKIETIITDNKSAKKENKSKPKKGFCLRCQEKIKYNPERPYCKECFYSWNEWENYDYVEMFCHSCGDVEDTTMNKPECYDCYKKNN